MIKYLLISFIISCVVIFQSCDDIVDSAQYYISGTVTFTDTFLTTQQGYYAISVFPDSAHPFQQIPVATDSLTITKSGYIFSANYRVNNLAAGNYFVGATWIRTSDNNIRAILGIYGCDTARNCSGSRVSIPNYSGTNSCNILSWTDTLKKLN